MLGSQMAAGDSLRVIYDQLSRDPASLSNLDQDLPNYAQHQVPIFSLPQVCSKMALLTPASYWQTVPFHEPADCRSCTATASSALATGMAVV